MDNPPSKKILIVEDEKPMARAIELKLTRAGFRVKVAYDGERALHILEGETFDLLLLDLVMPKKDGFSVLTEMRARNDTTPVIVMSNLSQELDMRRAKALGALDYFIKTDIPIANIVGHIKRVLHV